MATMSTLSIVGLNILIFYGILTQIILSRAGFGSPDYDIGAVTGTLVPGVFVTVLGLMLIFSPLSWHTVGRAWIIAGSTINCGVLVQLLFRYPQSGIELFRLVFYSFMLGEFAAVVFALVWGELQPEATPVKRKPLDDLKGVEAQLEAIEKKIMHLRSMMKGETKDDNPKTPEGAPTTSNISAAR